MGLLIKLKNGDTTLKSLKYGNDRPGGGDSGQPYVKNPIKEQTTPIDEDSILRGGLKAPSSAVEDVSRLTKYFFDFRNPNGLLFTTKQNTLSNIAPRTEASVGPLNEGAYTPLSTLTQAGVGFLGTHLNKQGLDPTGLNSSLSIRKYQDVVSLNNLNFLNDDVRYNNRLLQLWKQSEEETFSDILYSYPGGPGSALGIGNTNIKYSTRPDFENGGEVPDKVPKQVQTLPTFGYDISTQFGVLDQSKEFPTSDTVTSSPLYKSILPKDGEIDTEYRDIIPFYIGFLNYKVRSEDGNILPPEKTYLHFRAYVDNFGDSYKAKWKSISYMGRAESFYKYQSFDRDMNVDFTVVAESREEQNKMYLKLNYLASTLAPEYTTSGYMSGNIAYLTVGDYVSEQPGFIESLTFDIPDESPWETARDQDGNLVDPINSRRLPFMIKVKMKFQPIHTFRPERQKNSLSQLFIDQSRPIPPPKPEPETPAENVDEILETNDIPNTFGPLTEDQSNQNQFSPFIT